MLQVNNLCKSYGKHQVLNNISFNIESGRIFGFLGENGAGKTTTMNILAGLINFDSGDIKLNGFSFSNNKRKLLKNIGYLPQSPSFYNYMTAVEYLKFIGELKGEVNQKDILDLLEVVGLKEYRKLRIGKYSGGMKQRLGIAAALSSSPDIIFLDEPTSALDVGGRREVLDLILDLKKKGKTVFISTHILNDVERVCDQVALIHKGRIIRNDSLDNIKKDYVKPIYDIEFEEDVNKDDLKQISYVDNISVDEKKVSLHISDMAEAKQNILKDISNLGIPVVSLTLRNSNLEDIFLRLVNKDENI
ncbi:MAG: ABC transporter ATP-binding protein [Bacillota bacterium]|nr:ABC transporter ATP-binding protein [Bacillota bacterium]